MIRKKHVVALTDDQRAALDERDRGPLTRRERNRVHILLRADAGETDADIADDLGVSAGTVANVRRRFVQPRPRSITRGPTRASSGTRTPTPQ